jgi:hypothetical protein
MPHVSQLYFKTAIVLFVVGILMGLQMSISGNHNVIAAHAHTNLLGWVTMGLFGGYFALNPAKARTRLAMIQYGVYTLAVVVMTPSLYFMLQGNAAMEPLVAISSFVALAGVLLFGYIVFARDQPETVGDRPAAATG